FTFGDSASNLISLYSPGCDCVSAKEITMYIPPTATCGNNKLEGKEECDGASLGSQTCATKGFSGGSLTCANTCKFETDGCKTLKISTTPKTITPTTTKTIIPTTTKTTGGTDEDHNYDLPAGCQLVCPVDVCAAKSKK
ncbi:hypothetical protein J4417_03065, partial [Candidatus Woesearchaeota archaeon]|nr:hypothetical protein [Candidatus Woesearchaeota archaeon]